MAGMTKSLWQIIDPYLDEMRERSGFIRMSSEWEYLVNELNRYLEENPELYTAPFSLPK